MKLPLTEEEHILQSLSEFLPQKLTEIYVPEKILTINTHNTILLISSKKSENKFVLKILEKEYYNVILSKSLNKLTQKNILLPLQTYIDTFYVYLLYPYRKVLSNILLQNGLDYNMLCRLINEIGNAIITLHKHNILHLDITPDNIFLDEKEHFYLGDFSSSRLAKKNLFSQFFCKCLYTGTTSAFAPENTNKISFWNDQYSFALLLYVLFNNGNLPKQENLQKHCFFPTTNNVLIKAIKFPSSISKEMFSRFLSELESALQKDEEFFNCKNYQIQFIESNETICKSVTPDCITQEESKTKIQLSSFSNSLQIPIPLYGLLIFCGFLFLFSLYHYMAKTTKNTSHSIEAYHLQTASLPPPVDAEKAENQNTSNIKRETSSNAPDISMKDNINNSINNLEQITDFPEKNNILDISNSGYHNKEFLSSTVQPKSIQILFANSCQFTDSTSFSVFTNLEELYLYNNPLSSVNSLSKIQTLKTLVLSKCNLNDISGLAKIKSLTILDLSQNKHLKKITSLSSLKNLNYLIVTHTNISQEDIHLLQKKLPHCTILF